MRESETKHILLTALLVICAMGCDRHRTDKPNFLIILADDMGWNQLGCYGGPYHTPHIDSLARQGMRFTQAYASAAVCSPTRAAWMTGKYPARLDITDFIKGAQFPDSLLRQPDWQRYLPLKEITIAEILKEHGYRTALFGKWHLSPEKRPPRSLPFNPSQQGFDEELITYKPVPGETDPEHDPHNVDSIVNRAVRFLREEDRSDHSPFLLVVSHNAIHDPLMESRGMIDDYKTRFPEENRYQVDPVLGAMVTRLDEGVGRLLRTLKEMDLSENTVIFFCSDNGGKSSYASQYPFRAGKGWLYEGGIRVPMIVSWPGHIGYGSTCSAITSSMDLLPTTLDLAGLDPVPNPIDGTSIAGLLTGQSARPERERLFWHYPHYHRGTGMKPATAVRSGRYKLIEWHEPMLQGRDAWELYDLGTDPGESSDISATHGWLVDSLRLELHKWRMEVDAQLPEVRP